MQNKKLLDKIDCHINHMEENKNYLLTLNNLLRWYTADNRQENNDKAGPWYEQYLENKNEL